MLIQVFKHCRTFINKTHRLNLNVFLYWLSCLLKCTRPITSSLSSLLERAVSILFACGVQFYKNLRYQFTTQQAKNSLYWPQLKPVQFLFFNLISASNSVPSEIILDQLRNSEARQNEDSC